MRARRAVGLAALAAGAAVGISSTIRRRRGPTAAPRTPLTIVSPRTLPVLSAMGLRAYLQAPNWTGVFDGILGLIAPLFEWIVRPITWAVERGVGLALGIVEAFADVTRFLLDNAISTASDLVTTTTKLGEGLWTLGQHVAVAIPDIGRDILRQMTSLVQQMIADGFANVRTLIGPLVEAFLGPVLDTIRSLAGLTPGMLGFLIDFLTDPVGTMWELLEPHVRGILGDLADFAESIVTQGLNLIFGGYGDVVDVLKQAWRFLVWVGTLSWDTLTEIIDFLESLAGKSIGELSDLVTTPDMATMFENLADEWLS